MSCMTHESLKHISSFDTTRDAWTQLEKAYALQSRARVIQVKKEMQYLKKGGMSINDYVLKIKFLADDLEGAGFPLTE